MRIPAGNGKPETRTCKTIQFDAAAVVAGKRCIECLKTHAPRFYESHASRDIRNQTAEFGIQNKVRAVKEVADIRRRSLGKESGSKQSRTESDVLLDPEYF
jgi:hypothetical protein